MKKIYNKLHIVSWILKDIMWNLKIESIAKILIIPTLFFSFYSLLDNKNRIENLTLFFWICMNVSWMLHEFNPQIPMIISYLFIIPSIVFSLLLFIKRY